MMQEYSVHLSSHRVFLEELRRIFPDLPDGVREIR